ncbi:cysteine desulfurase family protein [Bacillus carboniphilus]|uniref:Cysteine desulfurase family protein n=1 Tax=Bacillus carboniphilus TaxID=86663 RepID=A0ABY9K0I0_9BACI|nr:cysteine desulfurase family protein [Bacillus carboniphilus]WLR44190.1 cysteine desulfurase family protein [Bacillus carboniphilus]
MLYLDNSATTSPYADVLETYKLVAEKYFANPSSIHALGVESEKLVGSARKQVAQLLGVEEEEILFTSGGTEGNNLSIKGIAFSAEKKGKHLITTTIEHPSVKDAFEQLKDLFNYEVTYIPVKDTGIIDIEELKRSIRADTVLVSVMHVNNETGIIQPVEEIGQFLSNYPNITYHVDYVQGLGKVPLKIKEAHIDLCTMSGHKIHAVNGIGVLFKRKGVSLTPLFSGGGQEGAIRSGTESVAAIVSFAKALRKILEQYENEIVHMIKIKKYLMENLLNIDQIDVNTTLLNSAPHIVNFSIPGIKAEVLVHMFEQEEIYVSTTAACSSKKSSMSHVLLQMGKSEQVASSSIRVSLSYQQTKEEIDFFLRHLHKFIHKLQRVMRD